jgi:hypothetical protein
LETVGAAKEFVQKQKTATTGRSENKWVSRRVADFLKWPVSRVVDALAQLAAIEKKELAKEAVEILPTQKAATALHREVQRAKERGKPITPGKHEEPVRRGHGK